MIRHPITAVGYEDGKGAMPVTNRPSPRQISTALAPNPYHKALNRGPASKLLTAFGQYVAVEITRIISVPPPQDHSAAALVATFQSGPTITAEVQVLANITERSAAMTPISMPPDDPFMTNMTAGPNEVPVRSSMGSRTALKFTRSLFQVDSQGVRAPINTVTACVDASAVYGASEGVDDGNRGLPMNVPSGLTVLDRLPTKLINMTNMAVPSNRMRAAGTAVVNQNPGLLVMATLWLREHNRLATLAASQLQSSSIGNSNGGQEDDMALFQHARKWVTAQMSHIIFDEYLPQVVGQLLPPYSGHNSSVNPAIDVFFATAAFRYGHAALTDFVHRLDQNWEEHPQGHLLLSQAYFQPDKVLSAGIEPLLRGFITAPQGRVEPRFAAAVQNELFGPANTNGSDLFSVNIQRGRDHGLPDYNTCRRLFGLPAARSFSDITSDPSLLAALQSLYRNNLSLVDAYVGGLAESPVPNGHVGPLFAASIIDQFRRLRDGDWWHYRNTNNGLFTPEQVAEIDKIGLRDILLRHTNITDLPMDIWHRNTLQSASGRACSSSGWESKAMSSSNISKNQGDNGSNNVAGPWTMLDKTLELTIAAADDPAWLRVKLVGAFGSGFVGFGVARSDAPDGQKMIGADIIISTLVNGQPHVASYQAAAHQPPRPNDPIAAGSSTLRLIRFERAGGRTLVEFERPLAAGPGGPAGPGVAVSLEGPNTFIVARGFALRHHTQHGLLMAMNFIVILPLGALMARQLRAVWLQSPALKTALFYVHVGVQLCGVALATAGFIMATALFGIPFQEVLFGHGTIGVVVLALVYCQLLLGFVQTPAKASRGLRSVWLLAHVLLGRSALLLGVANVFIGIYLMGTLHKGVWL
eukprot:gene10239-10398_t